jgi:phenylacetate-CoA ligase
MSGFSKLSRSVVYPAKLWVDGEWAEIRYLRQFEQTQYYTNDQIRALQLERLKKRLHHAYAHCPFYRRRWDEAGVHPSDVQQLEDLTSFPIVTKADIQKHRDEMVADDMPPEQMFLDRTGGSTGAPIAYYQSYDVHLSRAAGTKRHNRWAGLDIGDKTALVWGAPRDIPKVHWKSRLRNLLLDRTIYLDTACLTQEKLRNFNEQLRRFRPTVIVGYARSLALVAKYLQQSGSRAYQPRSIITSAEVLTAEHRVLIEQAFGCQVFDRYGCREVGVLASECEAHDGLHTMAEGLYIEVSVGSRLAMPSEPGKLLVTDLLNYAMPLIRYEIGDMASYASEECSCGRGLPKLEQVAGRVTDFIVGADGRLVSGVFLATYVVAKRPTLGRVQIWQDTPGCVLYRIASPAGKPPLQEDLQYLSDATQEYVGPGTVVECEHVAELASEPSGKTLFCRSTAQSDYLPALA